MAASHLSEVVQHLRRVALLGECAELTDGQLLECYVAERDEAAFAALVRRHGPMVWGVCRRILHNHHLAEDAFQATFLVLVRKAASILPRHMVANWLYGVACQTALKARAMAAKRGSRERQVATMPESAVPEQELWSDLQPLLDQEMSCLPEKYRVPVVLCDLQGKTRKQAAQQLSLPEGTIASRLARARTMLARRLARHGLAVSAVSLTTALSQNAIAAAVPSAVLSSTIKAAALFAAGQTAVAGVISAKAALLTEGVLKAMLFTKLKILTTILVAVGTIAAAVGTSGVFDQVLATGKPAAGVSGVPSTPKQGAKKDEVKAGKAPEVDWNKLDDAVKALMKERLAESLQEAHKKLASDLLHGRLDPKDCRSCHAINQPDNPKAAQAKGQANIESDQERIKHLEMEVEKLRNERELLQMEVWILLREIQRQKGQDKGAK